MDKKSVNPFLAQLRSILDDYNAFTSKPSVVEAEALIARSRSAVERTSGRDSAYYEQFNKTLKSHIPHDPNILRSVIGVVQALYGDIKAEYLITFEELVHGEVFADFLEMAHHLHDEGYKDAAAVIAGGTLEAHLRQLCAKHGIDTEIETKSGVRPKKADQMNADLAKADAYSKLDQKNITAWLDLRNKAAHGHYDEYGSEQVALLIAGIRDLITRLPA